MKKKTSTSLKITFIIWIVGSLGGMSYFSISRLVYFDPNNSLLDETITKDYAKRFSQYLTTKFGDVSGKAIHFSQEGCFCNLVAQSHISAVKSQIEQSGYTNENFNISTIEHLKNFIPSTPAVALFNDSGNLLFFGPYSTGYLCTAGNGFVEDLIIQMENKGQVQPITVSIARGCYCNNKQLL